MSDRTWLQLMCCAPLTLWCSNLRSRVGGTEVQRYGGMEVRRYGVADVLELTQS